MLDVTTNIFQHISKDIMPGDNDDDYFTDLGNLPDDAPNPLDSPFKSNASFQPQQAQFPQFQTAQSPIQGDGTTVRTPLKLKSTTVSMNDHSNLLADLSALSQMDPLPKGFELDNGEPDLSRQARHKMLTALAAYVKSEVEAAIKTSTRIEAAFINKTIQDFKDTPIGPVLARIRNITLDEAAYISGSGDEVFNSAATALRTVISTYFARQSGQMPECRADRLGAMRIYCQRNIQNKLAGQSTQLAEIVAYQEAALNMLHNYLRGVYELSERKRLKGSLTPDYLLREEEVKGFRELAEEQMRNAGNIADGQPLGSSLSAARQHEIAEGFKTMLDKLAAAHDMAGMIGRG